MKYLFLAAAWLLFPVTVSLGLLLCAFAALTEGEQA